MEPPRERAETEAPPAILHVEAGPTFGGSTLALQNYLVHADPSRFVHDTLFVCDVPGLDAVRAHSRRFFCLHCPAPAHWDAASSDAQHARASASWPRRAARRVPGARPAVRAARWVASEWRRELPLAVRIARFIAAGRYALVHCNNTFVVQPATFRAARWTRTPVIAHARTRVTLAARDLRLGNRALRIFAVSRSLAEDLHRQGIRQPVDVCYEGIDLPSAAAKREGHVPAGRSPVIAFAGRLVERKGVAYLLEALPALVARHPDALLWIAGDGPLREDLERQAAERNLTGAVSFLGFRGDVPSLLSESDLFALPSLTEGLPLVLLEAMAASLPIVACHVDGVPEFVRDGETGLLVPPRSADALARAMLRLCDDRAEADRLGRAARAFVEAHGDVRQTAADLDAAFQRALRERDPGARAK